MTQTFTVNLSANTILEADFIAELPISSKVFGGQFVTKQTFVDSGGIKTVAGEMIGARIERPVLGVDWSP
jgi:hypothetical protein